jgi:hypothetical protein
VIRRLLDNTLTDFGKQLVREMNRMGIMVDISHVSDKTFYDALAISEAPMISSHSSCRSICDAPRNMTDDMITALAAKGGVVQINYHVGFLSQEFRNADKANPDMGKAMQEEIKKRCGENEGCQLTEGDKITREYVAQGKLPHVEWTAIIDHIDHAVKLVGADHVGLGSDFDGATCWNGGRIALPKLPTPPERDIQQDIQKSRWQYAARDAAGGSHIKTNGDNREGLSKLCVVTVVACVPMSLWAQADCARCSGHETKEHSTAHAGTDPAFLLLGHAETGSSRIRREIRNNQSDFVVPIAPRRRMAQTALQPRSIIFTTSCIFPRQWIVQFAHRQSRGE